VVRVLFYEQGRELDIFDRPSQIARLEAKALPRPLPRVIFRSAIEQRDIAGMATAGGVGEVNRATKVHGLPRKNNRHKDD